MFFQFFEYLIDQLFVSFFMLLFCFTVEWFGVDCDVIHVDRQPSLSYFHSEDFVHHGLECGRRVGKTKEHYKQFKEALRN